jgi:predicted Zn-dependent protease
MIRKTFFLLFMFSLLTGCASTNLPPITSREYQPLPDEKRIWSVAEEEEQRLAESEIIFENQELTTYLNQVAMKVFPEEAKKKIDVEVFIIKNPYLNAFAYPNGKVYVHTGLLARLENEAQLATVLGHEMAHVTQRHMVREQRSTRNKAAGLASFNATFGALPLVGELSSVLGSLGTMAAVYGYSKGLETEADNIGFEWMVASGYDPMESPKVFEHMKAEMEEEEFEEPFFFGSHPKLEDRRANFQSFLDSGEFKQGGEINQETYEKMVAPAIYETADLDLKAGRFSRAEKGIQRYLKTYPRSCRAHFLLGEVYRQRNEEGDYKKAIEYLNKASKLNRKYAESYRSLGLIYMNLEDKKAARNAFHAYLDRAPKAEDRGFIQDYMRRLK